MLIGLPYADTELRVLAGAVVNESECNDYYYPKKNVY